MTQQLRIGALSKLYRDTASPVSWSAPTWAEITIVHDHVNTDHTWKEGDATTRGLGSMVLTEPTLLAVELTFTVLEDIGDAGFLALRTAFFTKLLMHLAVVSGVVTATGEDYVEFDSKVFGWKKGEPLDGVNTFDVTIKPCYSANLVQSGLTPITTGGSNGLA